MGVSIRSDRYTKYLVTFASVTIVVFFIINYSNFTLNPMYSLVNITAYMKGLNQMLSSDISLCPATILNVKDINSITKYQSQCSIHHLTKLPRGKSYDNDEVSRTLSFVAKEPLNSLCACPRQLKVADFPILTSGLLSFPGSGNTWARHLIQQVTGIQSGSVYKFASIKNNGFPYEGVTNNMCVVKSHSPPNEEGLLNLEYKDGSNATVQFDQLIILLRNPYAAFMAEYKRGSLGLGKVGNILIDNSKPNWKNFVDVRSKTWRKFIKQSFRSSLPYLIIFYEDMVSCLLPELIKIASFLKNKNLNEFSFCCSLKEHEGSFHRSPSNQTIEDVFSDQDKIIMNGVLLEAVAFVNERNPEVAKRIMQYILP